jgi:NADPH:quinone reductase-like Zn-dependent oxidoreductase
MTARARHLEQIGAISSAVAVPVPEPKPGELLLEINATSLNFIDLVAVDGTIPGAKMPRVPFSDASMTVLGLGDGVSGFAIGDRVLPGFYPYWQSGLLTPQKGRAILGMHMDGTLQTHICLPATSVARSPATLNHEEISALGCAGMTAWRSVIDVGQIQPGQTVVVQGTGSVSLFATAFAKMAGARVILTSSSDEKLERAQAIGADILINYRRHPDWAQRVIEETDGAGADLIVDLGGGATLSDSVRALKYSGLIMVVGAAHGLRSPELSVAAVDVEGWGDEGHYGEQRRAPRRDVPSDRTFGLQTGDR